MMAFPTALRRRDLAIALILTLIAAAFRLPRLGVPAEEIFDEVYHAKTALQYLHGEAPTEWVHPPTAKLLIAVGVWLFGYKSWAWRLPPALCGVLLAPVFYALARRVLATPRAAWLATGLLLTDGVYLVQSRTAMTNIFAVLFQVSSALFLLRAVLPDRLSVRDMMLAGLCLGLALSTRWTSLWAAGFLGLVFVAVRVRRAWRAETTRRWPRLTGEVACAALTFALIPAGLYVLSYVPWMRQGHALAELLPLQKSIWAYHANLRAEHPYFSKWYTWPWLYRPTWYYFAQQHEAILGARRETVRGIVAIGNPALWWVSIPISIWAVVTGLRARDPRRLFAGCGFFALYLPWGVSPRTLNYSHYLFEAIPYACLALGDLLDRAWDGRFGSIARGYWVLAIVLFFFFLPFLIALPVPSSWYYRTLFDGVRPWTWFPTWV